MESAVGDGIIGAEIEKELVSGGFDGWRKSRAAEGAIVEAGEVGPTGLVDLEDS